MATAVLAALLTLAVTAGGLAGMVLIPRMRAMGAERQAEMMRTLQAAEEALREAEELTRQEDPGRQRHDQGETVGLPRRLRTDPRRRDDTPPGADVGAHHNCV